VDAFDFVFVHPAQTLAIWALLAVLIVLLVVRDSPTLVLARDGRGSLEISRDAVHRVLEACCTQVRGIASARARVRRRRGRLTTELRLRIRPDAKLDAIQGYLTEEITGIYSENLGLKDIGPIQIKVVGVVSSDHHF
jgi:hypothetical protein